MGFFGDIFGKTEPKDKARSKPKYKFVYEHRTYNVGVTTALIIFDDGREVHTKMYGSVDQYLDHRFWGDEPEQKPKIRPAYVATSIDVYRQFITSFGPTEQHKIVDDPINPTIAWTGKIAHAEIVETATYEVTYVTAVDVVEDV